VHPPAPIVLSEMFGVQLHRQLVFATRTNPRPSLTQSLVQELLEGQFARLTQRGALGFGAA